MLWELMGLLRPEETLFLGGFTTWNVTHSATKMKTPLIKKRDPSLLIEAAPSTELRSRRTLFLLSQVKQQGPISWSIITKCCKINCLVIIMKKDSSADIW